MSLDFSSLVFQTGIKVPKGSRCAVAVSGGADSLALTFLLKDWARENEIFLSALTVDHGLRPDSAKEALDLAELLASHEIDHHILRWEGDKPTTKLQESARAKRYELMLFWCRQHGVEHLFLGHHAQDQLETFLMRLRQGSSILGCAGMRPTQQVQGISLVRPLLSKQKSDLITYLKARNIQWVEDPSNEKTTYERVFWRSMLESLNPDMLTRFTRVRESVDHLVYRFLKRHATHSPLGYLTLDQQILQTCGLEFQKVILSYVLQALGTKNYPPSLDSLNRICLEMRERTFSATTLQGLCLKKTKGTFLIAREHRAISETLSVSKGLWDNRFLIDIDLDEHESVQETGEAGWRQLLDLYPQLHDLPDPRPALWSLPAVWAKGTIHPTKNMVYQDFLAPTSLKQKKAFIFCDKYPFQALFFGEHNR